MSISLNLQSAQLRITCAFTSCFRILFLFASFIPQNKANEHWPMAVGPDGNWTTTTKQQVPITWHLSSDKNIKWKTLLPEEVQSGIVVWKVMKRNIKRI